MSCFIRGDGLAMKRPAAVLGEEFAQERAVVEAGNDVERGTPASPPPSPRAPWESFLLRCVRLMCCSGGRCRRGQEFVCAVRVGTRMPLVPVRKMSFSACSDRAIREGHIVRVAVEVPMIGRPQREAVLREERGNAALIHAAHAAGAMGISAIPSNA